MMESFVIYRMKYHKEEIHMRVIRAPDIFIMDLLFRVEF
jgi:hypothetical protein